MTLCSIMYISNLHDNATAAKKKNIQIGGKQTICLHKYAHAREVWEYAPSKLFGKLDALRLPLRSLLAQSGTTVIILICTSLYVWLQYVHMPIEILNFYLVCSHVLYFVGATARNGPFGSATYM